MQYCLARLSPSLVEFLVVPTFYELSARYFAKQEMRLTLEGKIIAKVDFHGLFRAFRPSFGIIYDSLLTDRKPDHRGVLGPFLYCRRNVKLLGQDLLEDVVGRTRAHCYSRTATLDTNPGNKIADGQMVGIIRM